MAGTTITHRYAFIILFALTLLLVIDLFLDDPLGIFDKLLSTHLLVVVIYIIYFIVITFYISRIEDEKTRLTALKLTWTLLIGLTIFIGLFYWVEKQEELLLILGIIWGASAIALRDMVQNFFGSLVVIFMSVYRIGDRISVKGVYGEVMDIGLLRTTLMQMDRVAGDIPTGEIYIIPNGTLFREVIGNTSRHTSVTWDEIRIHLPAETDFDTIREIITPIIEKHAGCATSAKEELTRLSRKKFLTVKDTDPIFTISLDPGGLMLSIRYLTSIMDRALIKTRISLDTARSIEELRKKTPETE